MTGNDEGKAVPHPPEGDRTIFSPLPGTFPPPSAAQPAPDGAGQQPDALPPAMPPAIPAPQAEGPQAPAAAERGEEPLPAAEPPRTSFAGSFSHAPITTPVDPAAARQIRVGDVLNHIFEVRRLIGRGGMGEVFEGINVNTDERVAIKVILPHLAADPAVQAMFRKEARTLTRLSHPALVQYRVLAQEPQLGALYIVTEYIDGPNLSDHLATLKPTPAELTKLLRRLAQGLSAAHALGAIHRDISPDNIMLEGGRLGSARVIDFGIAKDLDAAGQTIVGDGFAGKLNYVAPEQLGDFGREIGPWTDVYSLGLTMMAVILGRDVNMGATLVDAVDKRRAGLDLAEAPEALRPVLERMLKADPAERPRSMDDVLAMLDHPELAALASAPTEFQPGSAANGAGRAGLSIRQVAIGIGALALLLGGGLALYLTRPGATAGAGDAAEDGPVVAGSPPADPVASARTVMTRALPDIPCSWLELKDVQARGSTVSLSLQGVSGRSAEALDRIDKALTRAGMPNASINLADVPQIPGSFCQPVEAFNKIRAAGPGRLSVEQRKFEMGILPPRAGADAGKLGGEAVFTFDFAGLKDEVLLVGLSSLGEMQPMPVDKTIIAEHFEPLSNERYRTRLNTLHAGWSGILLLSGKGPFPTELLSSKDGNVPPDWSERFLKLAKAGNWKAEMVWYQTVDEVPN